MPERLRPLYTEKKRDCNMSLHKYVRRRNPAAREYLEIFLIQHS